MTGADIIAELGGRRSGDGWVAGCPAHEDRTPSLSVCERDRRVLLHCHAGCTQAAVIAALRSRGLWNGGARGRSERAQDRREYKRHDDGERERTLAARRLWFASRQAAGSIVESYLRLRGITVLVPPTIRFLPKAWHTQAKANFPAMIGAVQDCMGRLIGVHRTFLANDGQGKAPVEPMKMMLGHCAGGAVRLAQVGSGLAVAEGIETGLSVLQETGIPTWAGLSAGGIAALVLPPLPLAAAVIIFADHDPAGVEAAERAALRWHYEGRSVRVALPPTPGRDFNDLLRGVA